MCLVPSLADTSTCATIIMGTCCSSIWADRKTSLCVRSLTHLAYKSTYLLIKILKLYTALAFCLSSSFIRTQWFQCGVGEATFAWLCWASCAGLQSGMNLKKNDA